jgi:hypothetical protein
MSIPRISDNINSAIEYWWALEVELAQKEHRNPQAVRVWKAIHRVDQKRKPSEVPREKQIVSLSHVEKRIQKIERSRVVSHGERLIPEPENEPWQPWLNTMESPENTAFLLRLNAAKRSIYGGLLLQGEADWGYRLRPAIQGLPTYHQYRLVAMYAGREFTRKYLSREQAYTGDLDGLIAYQAWLPENREPYELAVTLRLIPFPLFIDDEADAPPGEKSFQDMMFPFLADMAERPGDFPGWSGMIVDLLAPQREAFFGDTIDKLDPHFIQWKDRFLKFWAGIQETSESTQEEGVSDEREHS